ncbi:MAG: hypothetical protein IIZ43_01630 [Eubacterium sp.]|nr:hypothetical protein [Eubacterium sp.]
MKVKCEYCGSMIDSTLKQCPHCGAPNENISRGGTGIPRTIEELLAFAEEKGLPLKKMRFFIGENYTGPKAFGIYKDDDGRFVVYKNKADGTRAVRYRGKDEAYAVNEIYQKLRSEVGIRTHQSGSKASESKYKARRKKEVRGQIIKWLIIAAFIVFVVYVAIALEGPSDGYYEYDDTLYYNQGSSWYTYSDDSWVYTNDIPSELSDDPDAYYNGYDDSGYDSSFYDSDYYDPDYYESDSSSSSWDSDSWDDDDWDYDYGGWDSGGTDWDSDWRRK